MGDWAVARGVPETSMRPYVRRYQDYSERVAGVARRRHPPSGDVPIIIGFGAPMRLCGPASRDADESHRVFVAGPHDRYGETESAGRLHGVQVDLTPIGAYMFFRVPMHSLTNLAVELQDLIGDEGRRLAERVEATPTPEARFDIIDEAIAARIAGAPPPSPAVVWAWRRLRETGGRVSIGLLGAEIGWSRKHFVGRFREFTGLSPKTLARILRFNRAVAMLNRMSAPRWAEIALTSGYYDQAHLIRDFVRFSGSTPTDFVGRQLPGRGMDGATPVAQGRT